MGYNYDITLYNGVLSGSLLQFANWNITIKTIGTLSLNGPLSRAILVYWRIESRNPHGLWGL
jgi:hypothetical protein